MNLLELVGVKAHKHKTVNDLMNLLIGGKFIKIGSGSFAHVFKHENGDIYKFWAVDTGYDAFVNLALENQDDPFFPKFLSKPKEITTFFEKPSSEFPDKFKYVKIESLKPLSIRANKVPGLDIMKMDSFIDYVIENSLESIEHIHEVLLYDENKELGDHYQLDELPEETVKFLDKVLPSAKKIMTLISLGGYFLDIHDGNIMLRGDQIVITDPMFKRSDILVAKRLTAAILTQRGKSIESYK